MVQRLAHTHVVRHKIKQLPHFVRVQLSDPCIVIRARADRGIELVVIGDVVTVQAFRARLKVGRRVTVRHSELMQIRNDLAGVLEGKLPIELESICRNRDTQIIVAHGSVVTVGIGTSTGVISAGVKSFASGPTVALLDSR